MRPDINELRGGRDEFEDCVGIAEWEVQPEGRYMSPAGHMALYSAETSVGIDSGSEMIYFLSRGPLCTGAIEFNCEKNEDGRDLTITVTAFYNSPEVLQHAKVCILEKHELYHGIGIQTSLHLGSLVQAASLSFHVYVSIPEKYEDMPTELDSFLVLLPLFSLSFTENMEDVAFRSVKIETTLAPVRIKSMLSETGEITTCNGPIEGNFNCTGSLELKASNAPINATVTLPNNNPTKTPRILMATSNSSITSQLIFTSTRVGPASSAFKATAQSSNGPLNITVANIPVDSVIQFEGSTSNAPVCVALHPAYEGDLYLSSGGMITPMLRVDPNTHDPSGQRRQRSVQMRSFGNGRQGAIESRVLWGSEEGRRVGSVALSTSNAPMIVTL